MSFRVVFMGTPAFAEPPLEALLRGRHKVVSVVTQPDRRVGRGRSLQPSPIKRRALEEDLPVMEPNSLRDESFLDALRSLSPDVIVLVAFGASLFASSINSSAIS